MPISIPAFIILCFLIFLAAFIDSIAGGGGLISVTAYVSCGLPVTMALGTNKFSAFCGAVFASGNYIRTKNYDPYILIGAVPAALIGSLVGSYCTLLVDSKILEILLLIATPILVLLVLKDKNYSDSEKEVKALVKIIWAVILGFSIGFYDGFYGPGTGTFLQMAFIMLVGISIKKACGSARIINLISNMGALITFASSGNVIYKIGIPCAFFSIIGSLIGSNLAIKKDVKIVKPMMLIVVFLLFTKILLSKFGIFS